MGGVHLHGGKSVTICYFPGLMISIPAEADITIIKQEPLPSHTQDHNSHRSLP